MQLYAYKVTKLYKEHEQNNIMKGRTITNLAEGYVFADDHNDAVRKLHNKFPSDEFVRYSFNLTPTSFIDK